MQCAVKAKSPKQLRQGFMSLRYQVDWNYSPLHRYTKSAYPSMPADTSEPVVSATAVHLSVRQSLLMTFAVVLLAQWENGCGAWNVLYCRKLHLAQTYVCIWCLSLTHTESFWEICVSTWCISYCTVCVDLSAKCETGCGGWRCAHMKKAAFISCRCVYAFVLMGTAEFYMCKFSRNKAFT